MCGIQAAGRACGEQKQRLAPFLWRNVQCTRHPCSQGRHNRAMTYYDLARSGITAAYRAPSRHLVSALLLMAVLTRAVYPDDGQQLVHAALALRIADHIPDVSPPVRLSAAMLFYAISNPNSITWPPSRAPIGAASRLGNQGTPRATPSFARELQTQARRRTCGSLTFLGFRCRR